MKKITAIVLAVLLTASLAACGGSGQAQTTAPAAGDGTDSTSQAAVETTTVNADEEFESEIMEEHNKSDGLQIYEHGEYPLEKIVVGSSGNGGSLTPFGRTSWGNVACRDLIYQKLVRTDSLPGSPTQGEMYLELAKSIEEKDELTYVITLWDNIYDSEGNHFTTSDVVFSIESYMATGQKGALSRLDHLEIVDDYTIIWHCSSPFAQGEMGRQMSNATMVTQAAYEASPDQMTTTPIGTGPYKLKSLDPSSSCVLEVNEDFWMRNLSEEDRADLYIYSLQNTEEIEIQLIKEAASRAMALQMGTVQAADNISEVDMKAFENNPDIQAVNLLVMPSVPILFNCSETSKCSDINLRKAICHAVDSASIANGVGCPAFPVYGFWPNLLDAPSSWKEGREYYDYDTAKAKEFLDQTSYAQEPLTLMYVESTSTAYKDSVIFIQSQLESVGIKVNLLAVEQSVYEVYETDPTMWDMRLDTFAGGDYCVSCFKYMYSGYLMETLNGLTPMLVPDETLDNLYLAIEQDPSVENIEAYDQYFTYDMCYGIGVIGYYNQVAVSSKVNAALGERGFYVPNAFTPKE